MKDRNWVQKENVEKERDGEWERIKGNKRIDREEEKKIMYIQRIIGRKLGMEGKVISFSID